MNKIFLFDCDQTIWTSGNHDYISSVVSSLVLVAPHIIRRVRDGNIFILKSNISELFTLMQKNRNTIGIVSDNRKNMVIDALKIFNIYKFFDQKAINIKFWKGYCKKQEMVTEILKKSEFKMINPDDVYWFDDKNYERESGSIGINFIRVSENTNLLKVFKNLL